MNKEILKKIIDSLMQPSGWVGIIGLITLFLSEITPEQKESIIQAGVTFASLIAAFVEW